MGKSARHGVGAVFTTHEHPTLPFAWYTDQVPLDLTYVTADGAVSTLDINLLEAIALLLGFVALVQHILSLPTPTYAADCTRPFIHVHLWCDNTSAMWWLIRNRTRSTFHTALYQFFLHLQLLSGVVATLGHIAGEKNPIADAVSREFQVKNGSTYRTLLTQPQVQLWPVSLDWLLVMAQQCSAQWKDTSQSLPVALMLAAKVCSPPSA